MIKLNLSGIVIVYYVQAYWFQAYCLSVCHHRITCSFYEPHWLLHKTRGILCGLQSYLRYLDNRCKWNVCNFASGGRTSTVL